MKKTLFKSLLLGFAALTALNASAELTVKASDYEFVPGSVEQDVLIYVEHSGYIQSIQMEFAPIAGLTLAETLSPAKNDRDETWPVDSEDDWVMPSQGYNTLDDGTMRTTTVYMGNMAGGYTAGFAPGTTNLVRLRFTVAEDFKGGQLILKYCKAEYNDASHPERFFQEEITEETVVCNITAPAAAGTPLKEIVENGVDGTEYTVKEDLAIVAKSDKGGYLFVSDGKVNDDDLEVNWMKIKATDEVYEAMKGWESIKGGTLIGVLSEANCNQTLTITKAAEEGGVVTASAVAWNLGSTTTKFAPKVNEVILLTGFWFGDEGAFRGYSGSNGGKKGQSATANFGWCDTNVDMQNGVLYKDIQSVAQLKKAWDAAPAGAPAKVAADDPLSFQNYVVYPLAISESQVITGVDNLNASKDVVSVQYVNAAGMVSTTPFKGVNMVVTRYADGSQVTTKVVK